MRVKQELVEQYSVFSDFQSWALERIATQERDEAVFFERLSTRIGRTIRISERRAFNEALNLLEQGTFLDAALDEASKWHSCLPGSDDEKLLKMLLCGVLRIGFDSQSSLLNFGVFGGSSRGKSSALKTVCGLLPQSRVTVLNSVTPRVIQYQTIDAESGESNPHFYQGRVILINEALAETSQDDAIIHLTTSGSKAKSLVISGARCVMIASLVPPADPQIHTRLVECTLGQESQLAKVAKSQLISANILNEASMGRSKGVAVIRAGYELLLSDPSHFAEPSSEVRRAADQLCAESAETMSTRRIKQALAFAQCIAASLTYKRGERRLTVEDLTAAFELLA
jgi:hypothetical protein